MKFLLTAINAKYIHSNLAVHNLKAYAGRYQEQIELGEYTINLSLDAILKDIYLRRPDGIGISCYIWNMPYVRALLAELPKLLPDLKIWLGGPEVSFDARELMDEFPALDGITLGEGERTFLSLMDYYHNTGIELEDIPGLVYRKESGEILVTKPAALMDLSEVPFCYKNLDDFENKIIYYESSRGCPFSCSYCLSSIDKTVRFRDLQMVITELDFFLEHKVSQVKFVDRTFNCKHSHSIAIWKHIVEHDNGITNFHFEISADLLNEEELELLSKMRPGLVQLEIGVQSVNPSTIEEIHRTMDFELLSRVVTRLNGFHNIHLHLDLIAGLPFEDYKSFGKSFDAVYALEPEQLQLGFLKVLKGSYMHDQAEEYGIYYKDAPPYEVLSTKWLTYGEILSLKAIEEIVEIYYNSGQFLNTMKGLDSCFPRSFQMYEALAGWYEEKELFNRSHNRIARYEILYDFIGARFPDQQDKFRNLLMYDLYLRDNVKSRPSFAEDINRFKAEKKAFFIKEEGRRKYLLAYEGYTSKQISKMAHIEVFEEAGERVYMLFDYSSRDPLTYNGRTVVIDQEDL